MREKLYRFMQGRNGMDELARAESVAVLVVLLLGLFIRIPIVYLLLWFLGIGLMVHMYFRVFSRNLIKRQAENQRYISMRYRMVVDQNKKKKEFSQRKTHRFYSCPQCRQRVRVPRGRGKICITCPKCRTEFTRRT